jgi:hypothetical protein
MLVAAWLAGTLRPDVPEGHLGGRPDARGDVGVLFREDRSTIARNHRIFAAVTSVSRGARRFGDARM